MNRASTYLIIVFAIIAVFSLHLNVVAAGGHTPSASVGEGTTGDPSGPGSPETGLQRVDPKLYLEKLYVWLLGFVGIAALFAFVYGGIQYMLSGANVTNVNQAKGWIWNGVWGIALAAVSFLILQTINPDLITHGFDIQRVIDRALYPSR